MSTVHQRPHLWLWHWKDGPGWVRSASDELRALHADGAAVIRVQLQDDGPVPLELVETWKGMGYKVWGAVFGTGSDPRAFAEMCAFEKRRLKLQGMDFNFEDPIREKDIETQGWWSESFAARFRELCPKLPCALDTYYGAAAGGMNLGAYINRNFRMNVQTYWGAEGLYNDPVPNIVKWCAGAVPPIPKATVKPLIRVTKNNAGDLAPFESIFNDCVSAGTKGLTFYYVDGADPTMLRSLVQAAVSKGAAYGK